MRDAREKMREKKRKRGEGSEPFYVCRVSFTAESGDGPPSGACRISGA